MDIVRDPEGPIFEKILKSGRQRGKISKMRGVWACNYEPICQILIKCHKNMGLYISTTKTNQFVHISISKMAASTKNSCRFAEKRSKIDILETFRLITLNVYV